MYLPRLYVYHSSVAVGSEMDATFKTMERRLLKGIMNPSLWVVWLLGLSLVWSRGGWEFLANPWVVGKLAVVLLITVIHMLYARWLRDFAVGSRPLSHVFFRVINEAPFVLMIIAILLVVLEPA